MKPLILKYESNFDEIYDLKIFILYYTSIVTFKSRSIYKAVSTPLYSIVRPPDDIDGQLYYRGPFTNEFPHGFGFAYDYIGDWNKGIMDGYGFWRRNRKTWNCYEYVGKFNFLYISFLMYVLLVFQFSCLPPLILLCTLTFIFDNKFLNV